MNLPFFLKHRIHPKERKLTAASAVRELPLPALLRVPLAMHLGAPAKAVVKPGDTVAFGQRVAVAGGGVSAHVHAPAAGKIAAVEPIAMHTGRVAEAVVIETAPSEKTPLSAPLDWRSAEPAELLARIADAGVVGMGGAGFPTHIKLAPPPGKTIDTLILNGAECEPWLTCDHRVMIERAADVWEGCRIVRKILGAKKLFVAIEDNKPDAIAAMRAALEASPEPGAQIAVLPTGYPQGAEKQQILALTGRVVPAGGLPLDVGCVVDNVASTLAVFDAVVRGLPLTHRVITVSGDAIATPANLLVPNGAFFSDLIAFCGGASGNLCKLICGGPMMGFAQPDDSAPTTKTTSGLLLFSNARAHCFTSLPCISCGRCVDACPMRLMPSELSLCIEADDIRGAETHHVLDCYECGACAYVCPARRPLVQHIRRAKAAIFSRRKK